MVREKGSTRFTREFILRGVLVMGDSEIEAILSELEECETEAGMVISVELAKRIREKLIEFLALKIHGYEPSWGNQIDPEYKTNGFIKFVIQYLEKCTLSDLRNHPVDLSKRMEFLREEYMSEKNKRPSC
jgi:hypothetical protein